MRKTTSVNRRNEVEHIATCPLAAAMRVLGGRWKPMILWYVAHGLDRWATLRASISGASDKMLWQQLRELERDGLLVRVVEGRRVRYALTALGDGLRGPLGAIEAWSRDGQVGERLIRQPLP
ncbi:MAG: helix-turn-helix transcriptional regulator [Rhodobacteraceae bacterium]|jgi:DNA-binding HxlR family transcriptional regulator|nr:helix-turn-helix transcriptional regulator [Paracoccaceae bacterium]